MIFYKGENSFRMNFIYFYNNDLKLYLIGDFIKLIGAYEAVFRSYKQFPIGLSPNNIKWQIQI